MNLTLLRACGQVKAEEGVSIVIAAIARESEGDHWKLVLLLKHVDQGQPHVLVLCHGMHENSLMHGVVSSIHKLNGEGTQQHILFS